MRFVCLSSRVTVHAKVWQQDEMIRAQCGFSFVRLSTHICCMLQLLSLLAVSVSPNEDSNIEACGGPPACASSLKVVLPAAFHVQYRWIKRFAWVWLHHAGLHARFCRGVHTHLCRGLHTYLCRGLHTHLCRGLWIHACVLLYQCCIDVAAVALVTKSMADSRESMQQPSCRAY